jgi:integrase
MAKEPTFKELLRLAYGNSRDKSLGQRSEVLVDLLGAKTKVKDLTTTAVNTALNTLKARGHSGSTVNRYLSIISKTVNLYRKLFNPAFALHISWQQEGSGRFDWLRKGEEENLHEHLLANDRTVDISLCIRILTVTGMRLGEFLSLELSQVEDGWIRLWQTKTDRPRSVPIQPDIARQLRHLIAKGLPKGHQIRRGLSEALKASGGNSSITPHSLRHTTATRLIKSGVNQMVVAKYMGHNSLKTTQRYVHIDDDDLQQAMDKMNTH